MTEFAIEPYAADAPLHVVAIRTPTAKYATYSNWRRRRHRPVERGPGNRALRLPHPAGRLELDNSAGSNDTEGSIRSLYEHAFRHELREPLPESLQTAHGAGFADYFLTARRAATTAVERRRRHAEDGMLGIASLNHPPLTDRN